MKEIGIIANRVCVIQGGIIIFTQEESEKVPMEIADEVVLGELCEIFEEISNVNLKESTSEDKFFFLL